MKRRIGPVRRLNCYLGFLWLLWNAGWKKSRGIIIWWSFPFPHVLLVTNMYHVRHFGYSPRHYRDDVGVPTLQTPAYLGRYQTFVGEFEEQAWNAFVLLWR